MLNLKNKTKVISFAAFVILLLSAVFLFEISRKNNIQADKIILIKPGISSLKIASILEEEEIIGSKLSFLLYSKLFAGGKKLIAGEYEFKRNINIKEVVNIISKGESVLRKITIPEGFTNYQIYQLLKAEARLSGEVDESFKEGYLFPDTYYFKYGDVRNSILKSMNQKMLKIIGEKDLGENVFLKNKNDLLVLASIIEKEAGNESEKKLIASVFYNRLKIGMKLQADPTALYAVTNGTMELGRKVTKADMEIDSPYNTYKYPGLPPAPIANPGLSSIEAALKPASTKYLYFVVDGKGGHNFSKSYDEHNKFIKQYRDFISQNDKN